jgi:hypothetical protein
MNVGGIVKPESEFRSFCESIYVLE